MVKSRSGDTAPRFCLRSPPSLRFLLLPRFPAAVAPVLMWLSWAIPSSRRFASRSLCRRSLQSPAGRSAAPSHLPSFPLSRAPLLRATAQRNAAFWCPSPPPTPPALPRAPPSAKTIGGSLWAGFPQSHQIRLKLFRRLAGLQPDRFHVLADPRPRQPQSIRRLLQRHPAISKLHSVPPVLPCKKMLLLITRPAAPFTHFRPNAHRARIDPTLDTLRATARLRCNC